jgi:hypothetical protein
VICGCALLPVGALLWRLSQGPVPARLLLQLAAANLATCAATLSWRIAATGFSPAGSALTIAAAAGLALLATAQLGASAGYGVNAAPSAEPLPPQTSSERPVQTPIGSSRPRSGACGSADQRSARGS